MRLFIKNKIISDGGDSLVTNESGDAIYRVKGEVNSFLKVKIIKDSNNTILYEVKNSFWNFMTPVCFIYNSKKKRIAKVKDKSFEGCFAVEYKKNSITIEGKMFDPIRNIVKNGNVVGKLIWDMSLVNDSFILDIDDKENIAFYVSLIIAMDNIGDRKKVNG